MKFLEKNLEDIIFEQLQKPNGYDILNDRGLFLERKPFYHPKPTLVKRQLKIGNYGRCDIVILNREHYESINIANEEHLITVLELKQGVIDLNTLIQSARYAKGIKRYLDHLRGLYHYKIKVVLIGDVVDIDSNWFYLFDLIPNINEFIEIFTYKYDFDGITFEEHDLADYKLTNEGF
jgi:hypothetical protein